MILEVVGAVREIAPRMLPGGHASVACIQTTRPKYLVFGSDRRRPECVVEFGPEDELRRVHETLTRLEPLLPGLVPTPVACALWRDPLHVQIQGGLEGAPWFRLQQAFRTAGSWETLESEALLVLRRFQEAVRWVPEWASTLVPEQELRRQVQLCEGHGVELSAPAWAGIRRLTDSLCGLGAIRGVAQHGDYSLNNLLRSDDGRMRVIDFEEFGLTHMPLHDEVGLALSMRALGSPRMLRLGLEDHIRRCVQEAIKAQPELAGHVRALAVHHALWRINRSCPFERRARARQWLVSIVEQLAAAPAAA